MVELPYGRQHYQVATAALAGRRFAVLTAPARPTAPALRPLLDDALAAPVGRPPLAELARSGARITVIVSDPTRHEPRAAFLQSIRDNFADARWTIAIATGTHGPCRLDDLGLPRELLADATIVNHDGHDDRDLVELGTTGAGTAMRVHRCVVEADLVIATGCIRPHYFAGFGAGAKAIFPGLGAAAAIRHNHRLKAEHGARAGIVDGNPCRADLEAAVSLLPTPTFLVNGVCAPDGDIHAVVAGDLRAAFRAGAELARPWFTVRAQPAAVVVASDAAPVTTTLYQAAKIAAAAAPLVEAGGILVIAAECADGIGPLAVVNDAILRLGVLPRLPTGAKLVLVSGLAESEVNQTCVGYARSVEGVLETTAGEVLFIPRASQLICESSSCLH